MQENTLGNNPEREALAEKLLEKYTKDMENFITSQQSSCCCRNGHPNDVIDVEILEIVRDLLGRTLAFLCDFGGNPKTMSPLIQHLDEMVPYLTRILSLNARPVLNKDSGCVFYPSFLEMEARMKLLKKKEANLPEIDPSNSNRHDILLRDYLSGVIRSFDLASKAFSAMQSGRNQP